MYFNSSHSPHRCSARPGTLRSYRQSHSEESVMFRSSNKLRFGTVGIALLAGVGCATSDSPDSLGGAGAPDSLGGAGAPGGSAGASTNQGGSATGAFTSTGGGSAIGGGNATGGGN